MTKKLMMMAAAVAAAFGAWAETETVGGYTWTYRINGNTAEIYNYDSVAISPEPSGAVTIPSTLGGKTVTRIGNEAFRNCIGLTSVTLPDCVINIGDWAFASCTGLANVVLPNSLVSFAACVFYDCSALASLTIPNSVTNIGWWAFYNCSGLPTVTIPSNVVSIDQPFSGCSGLTSVTLCQKDVSRMSDLFPDAYQNISVKIANTVERIAKGAFDGCKEAVFDKTSIAGVHLVDGWAVGHDPGISGNLDLTGIRGIADGAFEGCDLLTHVKIPNGVRTIGANAFNGCSGMRSLQIPPSVARIGGNAFGGCAGLGAVVISDVAAWARISFEGWESNPLHSAHSLYLGDRLLTDITLPGDILHIGQWQFYGANSITNFVLLKGVESIGDGAFEGCSKLMQITIPSSITNIGFSAFASCTSLDAVRAESILSWCRIRFAGETANPVSQARHLYFADKLATSLIIPRDVKTISQYAFSGCSDIAYAVVPETVIGVGCCAFRNCSNLKWVWYQGNTPAVEANIYEGTPEDLTTYVPEGSTGWLFMDSTVLPNEWPQNDSAARVIAHGTFDAVNPPRVLTFKGNLESLYAGYEDHTEKRAVLHDAPIGEFPATENFYREYYAWGQWDLYDTTWYKLNDGAYYTLTGWWTALDGGMQITTNTVVRNDATYYAHWLKMWEVGWDSDGGWCKENGAWVATNGCSISKMAVVQKDGCVFTGWFTAVDGGRKITADTIMDESYVSDGVIRFYAHWVTNAEPEPTPTPAPEPTPEPVVVPELYDETEIAGVAPATAASEYNGYLVSANGNVAGTIQVKVGKPKAGLAAVKATVVVGGAKKSLKADGGKAAIAADGPTTMRLVGGESCEVTLGAEGLSGTYGTYVIDGARNFFASKDKSEQSAANGLLAKWSGPVNVVWNGGNASVSIGKKGKAKVAVTLADGTKATANAQLLVGEEWLCVPIVVTKKMNLAFTLWLPRNGGAAVVEGLPGDISVGKAGALRAGAKFRVGKSAALWQQIAGKALTDHLPDGMEVTQSGAKWTLPKAGKVQKAKDGTIDSSKLGDNPSALKLTYKAKDGSFKGSFKVYAENGGKLKATNVNVAGVMVNGVGYGTATIRNVGSVAIEIR